MTLVRLYKRLRVVTGRQDVMRHYITNMQYRQPGSVNRAPACGLACTVRARG